jgi:glutamate-1-semialdehyde 2,1-aminomutase
MDAHEVAGVILEPAAAHTSVLPTDPSFLHGLRDLTRERGAVLIFDEVVTGFRMAPGGALVAPPHFVVIVAKRLNTDIHKAS